MFLLLPLSSSTSSSEFDLLCLFLFFIQLQCEERALLGLVFLAEREIPRWQTFSLEVQSDPQLTLIGEAFWDPQSSYSDVCAWKIHDKPCESSSEDSHQHKKNISCRHPRLVLKDRAIAWNIMQSKQIRWQLRSQSLNYKWSSWHKQSYTYDDHHVSRLNKENIKRRASVPAKTRNESTLWCTAQQYMCWKTHDTRFCNY